MEKKKISIVISGATGAGKSTVAAYIMKAFSDAKVEVKFLDEELSSIEHKNLFAEQSRLEAALSNVAISLETKQLKLIGGVRGFSLTKDVIE